MAGANHVRTVHPKVGMGKTAPVADVGWAIDRPRRIASSHQDAPQIACGKLNTRAGSTFARIARNRPRLPP